MLQHPRSSVMLQVPDCQMQGSVSTDRELMFIFGQHIDGPILVFNRPALERFVNLANETLALEPPADPDDETPVVNSPAWHRRDEV